MGKDGTGKRGTRNGELTKRKEGKEELKGERK